MIGKMSGPIHSWVLAVSEPEAMELAEAGFGYDTYENARAARAAPEIDEVYRVKLRVYEVTTEIKIIRILEAKP